MKEKLPAGATLARGFSENTVFPWSLMRSDELFELKYGKALVDAERRQGAVPVFGTNGRCGWHDAALFQGPGVVLGRKGQGPLGVEWVGSDYWVIDTAYALRSLRDDTDLRFAYYLIKYVGLNHLKDGTSNPTLSRLAFGAQVFPMPPAHEQRAIARVLTTLDDKIELNRRTNETLEAMARALFKSWFVDFDPVRAKHGGARQLKLFGPAAASLFPDRLEPSSRGEIPQGWSVRPLEAFISLQRGTTYKSALLGGKDGPVLLGLATIKRNGGFRSDSLRNYGGESPEKLLLRPGDLYVSLKDVTQSADLLGSVSRVPKSVPLGRLTQDTVKLVFDKEPMPPEYVYQLLLTEEYRDYCRGRGTGTTNLALSREDFLSFPCVVPPSETLESLMKLISPLSERSESIEEMQSLSALRDALLPKLLSGELRVPDAERIVGKAV